MRDEFRYTIETITSEHDVDTFDCGEQSLNDYLRNHALENTLRKLGITYIATLPGSAVAIAYYTLSSAQIERETMPKRISRSLPHYPVPAIRIGRLGVDQSMHGQGLGSELLVDALYRSLAISESIGAYLVIVDALHDRARDFYLHYGFEGLADAPRQLFMTMKKIKGL